MTAILKHIINLYESGEQTKAEDYCTRVSGEIPTQVYPLFPIKRERAIYSRVFQSISYFLGIFPKSVDPSPLDTFKKINGPQNFA